MKSCTLLRFLFLFIALNCIVLQSAWCQSIAINTDGSTADASAILDVKSTIKGMLIPRMTTAQRTAIATPATGLLVYDTDTKAFWYYNGLAWTKLEAAGSNWSVTGNSGTAAGPNFMGSIDSVDVVFKTSNTECLRLLKAPAAQNNIATITGGDLLLNGLTVGRGSGNSWSNTVNGYQALYSNTTGSSNTAVGYSSLYSNTGSYNTAIGAGTLYSNTTGADNTAVGSNSLYHNTTGSFNIAIGSSALNANTTGNQNTAIGWASMMLNSTGGYNAAYGPTSLYSNTTGTANVAIGPSALYSNTSGSYNTASGSGALYSNSTGNYNVATGYYALNQNTTGYNNVANGYNALYLNITGYYNVASGDGALISNSSGASNVANGSDALYLNTTGTGNTGDGYQALYNNTTGNYNTALGYFANVSQNNLTNATAIGYNAAVNASNKIVIGNSAVTVIGGQVGWSTLSDGRFKTNIKEDVPGLNFILQLRPVSYHFASQKFEEHLRQNMPDSLKKFARTASNYSEAENMVHTGFIAQEVEQVVKKNGYRFNAVHAPTNATDNYSITYDEFVVPLVKAVQEESKMIEAQKKIISEQQQKLNDLEKRLEKLEQK
jgi:hypothetical protein